MIRNITKEDLATLASLVGDSTLSSRDDICYEHSMVYQNENGDILAAIVLIKANIQDVYGSIPNNTLKKPFDVGYYCGCETAERDDIMNYFPDKQYEIISMYILEGTDSNILKNTYDIAVSDNHKPIGVVWLPYYADNPIEWCFYDLNHELLVDIPYVD